MRWCWIWIILAVACQGKRSPDTDSYFRYNLAAGLTSLDPAFAKNQANNWVTNHLYDGLVALDTSLQVQPALARSWSISSDGRVYTFVLRKGVTFHRDACFPGEASRQLTAHDVVYSFSRIMDPEVASPGAWIFNNKVDTVAPFVALNDTVFQLRLLEPFRPMLGILAMQYCSIVPEEAVRFYGPAFRKHPVGAGPFQLQKWVEGEGLLLHRNEEYYRTGLPRLDGVEISFIDNKGMEFLAFLDGQLDFVSDIDAGLKDLVLTVKGTLRPEYQEKMRLIRAPFLNVEYLGIRMDSSRYDGAAHPLMDKRIRQAINYGFDRSAMLRFLRNSKGVPGTYGMIPPGLPTFDPESNYGYSYKPEKAKALLAGAGYPNGRGLPTITLYAPPTYMDLCEFIQSQLADIGIRLSLEVTQPALLRSRMEKGEAPFFRASWIADYPDAENYMALFYSRYGAPPNYTHFSHPVADSLYREAMAEEGDAARQMILRQMDSLVMSEAPVVPLYYDEVYRFVSPKVVGLTTNAMNLLDLSTVILKP